MLFGWYLVNKDRRMAIRLKWFFIIMLIVGVLLGYLFPGHDQRNAQKESPRATEVKDSGDLR
jgi:hypothetical protein